jgi:integrase
MRIKLTKAAIAKLKAPDPSGKQRLFWDTELAGLGLLVSGVTSTKTFVVQRDLPGGHTRRVTLGPANVLTVDAARDLAKVALADFYQGIDPKIGRRGSTTLRGTLDAYLAARKTLRPKSVQDYRASIVRYLAPWLDRPLREITPEMVEARHRSLQAEVEAGGRYSGNATANATMQALRVLWNFALEREPGLPTNPVSRLKRQWFPVHRRERCIRAEEMPKFYAAANALPNAIQRDYLLLLLFTGMRRSEAASLTWNDVDFGQRIIRVPALRTKAGRKLDLPMPDFVEELLVARRALGNAKFVFPSHGATGHIAEPKFPLLSVAKTTGITVSAHDLRRTFVTVAESCDISVMALKALVNHALGSDVTGGYVQMTAERLRDPAQRVCDKIKELCGIPPVEGKNVKKLRRP